MKNIDSELESININTRDYIDAEYKIIRRFQDVNCINIIEWVERYAEKFRVAVMKLKKLDIILLENEIYRS